MNSNSKVENLTESIVKTVNEKNPKTVQELIVFLQKNGLWSQKEILDAILKLQGDGKISLVPSHLLSSSGLANYLRTHQARWYWVTVAIALLSMVFSILIKEDFILLIYFRNVFGLIFVLWLPGYTFLRALFPINSPKTETSTNLGNAERIALSVILSFALVALISLLLNFSQWGINLNTEMLSLFTFSLVFATAAIQREYSLIQKPQIQHKL